MLWKTSDEFPGSISLPFGIKTSHTWHEIGQILRIVNDLDIKTFVELGAHVGGLASILSCIKIIRPFNYYGLEIDRSIIDPNVLDKIVIADILWGETVHLVEQWIHNDRSLIYCDNGNKIEEMRIYNNILKQGDIIMCHDYYGGQIVVDLYKFGETDECGCKPEVWYNNLDYLFNSPYFRILPDYLLEGTRIIGFEKINSSGVA